MKYIRKKNKVPLGVIGAILSILGLLLAFQPGANNTLFFYIYLIMVIIGIILVSKALSN